VRVEGRRASWWAAVGGRLAELGSTRGAHWLEGGCEGSSTSDSSSPSSRPLPSESAVAGAAFLDSEWRSRRVRQVVKRVLDDLAGLLRSCTASEASDASPRRAGSRSLSLWLVHTPRPARTRLPYTRSYPLYSPSTSTEPHRPPSPALLPTCRPARHASLVEPHSLARRLVVHSQQCVDISLRPLRLLAADRSLARPQAASSTTSSRPGSRPPRTRPRATRSPRCPSRAARPSSHRASPPSLARPGEAC